jgi:hypothetical protein
MRSEHLTSGQLSRARPAPIACGGQGADDVTQRRRPDSPAGVAKTRHANAGLCPATPNGSTPSIRIVGEPTNPRSCACSWLTITVLRTCWAVKPTFSSARCNTDNAPDSFEQSGTPTSCTSIPPIVLRRSRRANVGRHRTCHPFWCCRPDPDVDIQPNQSRTLELTRSTAALQAISSLSVQTRKSSPRLETSQEIGDAGKAEVAQCGGCEAGAVALICRR